MHSPCHKKSVVISLCYQISVFLGLYQVRDVMKQKRNVCLFCSGALRGNVCGRKCVEGGTSQADFLVEKRVVGAGCSVVFFTIIAFGGCRCLRAASWPASKTRPEEFFGGVSLCFNVIRWARPCILSATGYKIERPRGVVPSRGLLREFVFTSQVSMRAIRMCLFSR